MPVSEDNPYMGANLFLAKEMEQSVYLYNFMRDKGALRGLSSKAQARTTSKLTFSTPQCPKSMLQSQPRGKKVE